MIGKTPIELFETAADFEQWLEANQSNTEGVWLKIAKKGSGKISVLVSEALDACLCYGWIDGQRLALDDAYFLQKYVPRRPKSTWSKVNVEKVAVLTAAGRMKPGGLAAVEMAKQDGRWDQAYESQRNMTVPVDFQAALDANPKAKEFFATLNKTNTYAFCFRIETAKKPETRQARIEKFIAMLSEGKAIY